MPRMIASDTFPYAGHDLKVGEEFDASDNDAKILKAVGKAQDAPKKQALSKTRALKAGAENTDVNEAGPGRYNRADMRAED